MGGPHIRGVSARGYSQLSERIKLYAEQIIAPESGTGRGLSPDGGWLVLKPAEKGAWPPLAAAVPGFVRIDPYDMSISNKTLKYRPRDPMLLFSL